MRIENGQLFEFIQDSGIVKIPDLKAAFQETQDENKKLGEILNEVLKNTSFENRVNEIKLKEWWTDIVGKKMAEYVVDFSYRDKKLYIRIRMASARSDLHFIRTEVKNRLNERAGEVMVEEIVYN